MRKAAPPMTLLKVDGLPLAPGYGMGLACAWRKSAPKLDNVHSIDDDHVGDEYQRIIDAARRVDDELRVLETRVTNTLDRKLAGIFHAQRTMLIDEVLLSEFKTELNVERVNAECVVVSVMNRWSRKFNNLKEKSLRDVADDIDDLNRRLLNALRETTRPTSPQIPRDAVVVTDKLLPSDTLFLNGELVRGIVLSTGGVGSHAALLAQGCGIPVVSGADVIVKNVSDGARLLVDGFSGEIIAEPSAEVELKFIAKVREWRRRQDELTSRCHQPAKTKCGLRVPVLGNAGDADGVIRALRNGADGIGLFRLENLLMRKPSIPTVVELFSEMAEIALNVKDKPFVARFMDIGGEKCLPYLSLPEEANPQLGRRGLRLYRNHPELLDLQIEAILRLSDVHGDVRALVPMVTLAEEMASVRQMWESRARWLGVRTPPLGAMIETPAAALCAEEIAAHADFLSVGTNDLTQYTMAAGRDNPDMIDYYRDAHRAVLSLIERTVDGANGKTVGLCGNLATRLEMTSMLLNLGIRELSVPQPRIPEVKEAVRSALTTRRPACGDNANRCFQVESLVS